MDTYTSISDNKFYFCPYCNNKYKGSDFSEGLCSESINEYECGECGKEFDYWYECIYVYKTKPKQRQNKDSE
jgi:hypothetical protein